MFSSVKQIFCTPWVRDHHALNKRLSPLIPSTPQALGNPVLPPPLCWDFSGHDARVRLPNPRSTPVRLTCSLVEHCLLSGNCLLTWLPWYNTLLFHWTPCVTLLSVTLPGFRFPFLLPFKNLKPFPRILTCLYLLLYWVIFILDMGYIFLLIVCVYMYMFVCMCVYLSLLNIDC